MYEENREKAERLLDYLEIHYEKITRNALNVTCPFCDDNDTHCGIYLDRLSFSCWKCKASGSLFDLVNEAVGIAYTTYKDIIGTDFQPQDKDTASVIADIISKPSEIEEGSARGDVVWPPAGTVPIHLMADDAQVVAFIALRGFANLYSHLSGMELAKSKGVYIGVVGRYSGRFVVPIYYQGKVVAYQARDMSGRAKAKYLTEGDVSYFLYNLDSVDQKHPVAITEGIFDTWAVEAAGINSVSSFSAALSDQQMVLMLAKDPPYWILCWDMGADGSDAFWKGRVVAKNLASQFGPGKMRAVALPAGEDMSSLGSASKQYLEQATEVA